MQEKVAEIVDLLYVFRKYTAFFLLLLVAIVFRIINYIDGAQFVDLMKSVGMSFFAVGGVEHITTMVKEHLNVKLMTDKPVAPEEPKAE